jgi:hypothetical protein
MIIIPPVILYFRGRFVFRIRTPVALADRV